VGLALLAFGSLRSNRRGGCSEALPTLQATSGGFRSTHPTKQIVYKTNIDINYHKKRLTSMSIIHRLSIASILLFFAQQANAELTLSLDWLKDSGNRNLSASYSSSEEVHEIDDSVADSTGYRLRLSLNSVKENRVEFYFSQ